MRIWARSENPEKWKIYEWVTKHNSNANDDMYTCVTHHDMNVNDIIHDCVAPHDAHTCNHIHWASCAFSQVGCCVFIFVLFLVPWLPGSWAIGPKLQATCRLFQNLWSLRSFSVSVDSLKSPASAEHVEAQKVLVKQMCRRATRGGSDVRLDTGQFMRPDVWQRAPTDPSRWTWKTLHSWKWKHNGHITELETLSPVTAVRWRARSSSLLHNHSTFAVLIKCVPVLAGSMLSRGRQLQPCSARWAGLCTRTRNPTDAGSRNQHATSKSFSCTEVITPLVMLCSTRSHNIACNLVDRKDLYNSCEYNHEHDANAEMQSLRSQPGFVMTVSHPHLAKIILTLTCANSWGGSGAKKHMWAGQEMQSVVANFSCKRNVVS